MRFLIKGAFWFSLVLVMLPIFDKETPATTDPDTSVEIGDAVSAATQAISYVGAICTEKPDVCVKGAQTVEALGHRAKEGARIAYGYLDEQFADKPPQLVEGEQPVRENDLVTGSVEPLRIPIPVKRPIR